MKNLHLVLITISMLPICVMAVLCVQQRRRQDPLLYYGKLKLTHPIHGGFTYALDGGSITANLVDSNGVRLDIVCSPPGGLDGKSDISVYMGSTQQMWSNTAKPIERGGHEAKQIAEYVASIMPSMRNELERQEILHELDDAVVDKVLLEQCRLANRVVEILTTTDPLQEEW